MVALHLERKPTRHEISTQHCQSIYPTVHTHYIYIQHVYIYSFFFYQLSITRCDNNFRILCCNVTDYYTLLSAYISSIKQMILNCSCILRLTWGIPLTRAEVLAHSYPLFFFRNLLFSFFSFILICFFFLSFYSSSTNLTFRLRLETKKKEVIRPSYTCHAVFFSPPFHLFLLFFRSSVFYFGGIKSKCEIIVKHHL